MDYSYGKAIVGSAAVLALAAGLALFITPDKGKPAKQAPTANHEENIVYPYEVLSASLFIDDAFFNSREAVYSDDPPAKPSYATPDLAQEAASKFSAGEYRTVGEREGAIDGMMTIEGKQYMFEVKDGKMLNLFDTAERKLYLITEKAKTK